MPPHSPSLGGGSSLLRALVLALALLPFPVLGQASPLPLEGLGPESILGSWKGELQVSERRLPLVFNLSLGKDGLRATMDSPSQGAWGLPTSQARLEGRRLSILMAALGASFVGDVDPAVLSITGTWSQGAASLALRLERTGPSPGPGRPQTPAPPFPYKTEELRVPGGPGVSLAGTLALPAGPGPHPAVLLVSGGGPQDRDETILGHKPFLVIADYLCRRGIAILRLDDRGVGASTGKFVDATSLDFAEDAEAALLWLAGRPGIDPRRLGLAGHSEGGLVAAIVAARNPAVRFVILLAGPGLPGKELLLLQTAALMRAKGAPEEDILATRSINARLYALATSPGDPRLSAEAIKRTYLDWIRERPGLTEDQKAEAGQGAEALAASLLGPWMRGFLGLDPRPALARLAIPVLAMNGTKDLQVPARENLEAIGAAMAGSSGRLTSLALPGLNHLFQHARTGLPSEYGSIEESFAPEALGIIADWILAR